MKQILTTAAAAFILFSCAPARKTVEPAERLTDFINPFIGTGAHGHTFPGAAYPFGMIQISPDNGTNGWDWCSGYHYSDSIISGFSHLHLSGTGIGDLADLSFLPVNSDVIYNDGEKSAEFIARYAAKFSHTDEEAKAGYYTVKFKDSGISSEFTVTERAALHHYTFPENGENNLMINLGFAINWDKPYETEITIQEDKLVTGKRLSKGWAEDQHLYFAARFSEPVTESKIFTTGPEASKVALLKFGVKDFYVKVGVSSVSVENAIANLDNSLTSFDFQATKQLASDAWEEQLSKIRVTTADEEAKTTFYTALYHTMISPSLFSDLNGQFKGVKGDVQKAEGYNRYTIFSLWDTFRALHPLFTIIESDRVNDMVKTMLDHYNQTGRLPVWELVGNETNCMVGNHAVPVIADAILKGIGDFDVELAFKAMKESVLPKNHEEMAAYDKYGYVPSDKFLQSVSKTLEYAYDDWCIAAVAQKLNRTEDYAFFSKRAENYRNIFDSSTGFMRGKLENGSWVTPFDPLVSNHFKSDYTEGNAWQYVWFVPQNVPSLIELLGGKEAFYLKLDSLFTTEEAVRGEEASPDISGLIGQYAHGNEPSHSTAYLFNECGQAWRTQELVRFIQTTMYYNGTEGICGNEDCGQMSAWYVLSSIGIYPLNAADQKYQFGSPLFEKAEIKLANGTVFSIMAPGASEENKYIQSVSLNGVALDRSFITHEELLNGGTLEFVMGNQPNKSLFNK